MPIGEPKPAITLRSEPRRRERQRVQRALAAVLLLSAAFGGCAEGPTWMAGHEAP